MNLREVQIATLRISKVLDLIQAISGERLKALLEHRGGQPCENSPESKAYDEGFREGLNAGLTCRSPEVQDFDAAEAVKATTALPDD